ncbi:MULTISPECIES: hypothetical protein [Synechococcales]|uniref:hypothetical protein n=1 Tax=Synechococcales TaxID=1890424 RepID=UPI000B994FD2|nr:MULTISPECIES: hypothetical protein [Synechococcales]
MAMDSGNGFSTRAGDSTDIGRSVMKWGRDGELSALDLQSILERLRAVDDQAASLMDCPLDLPG